MLKKIFFYLLLLLFVHNITIAQSILSHEIGITIGPATVQSDYGVRHDFKTNTGNSGISVGLIHYLNFSSGAFKNQFFNEHVRVRSELSLSTANLKHFGKWVDGGNNTLGKEQLRAMSGTSKLINLGVQGEFNFINIHDFENRIGGFGPYVSLGLMYSLYTTKVSSTLGPLGDSATTFPKYLVPSDGRSFGFSSESKPVFSVVAGFGTRYKLAKMSDLLLDMRFQYFNSDWVDGLNPNKDIYKENQANDWMVWLNIGYIHYLEF